MQFETVATGLNFSEGPVALPDRDFLVVRTLDGLLCRVEANGSQHTVADLGGGPNGTAMGPDGRAYVCNNGGVSDEDIARLRGDPNAPPPATSVPEGRIEAVDLATGLATVLYADCGDEPIVAPNDLVFDRSGGFYATDFGSLKHPGPQPSVVYYGQPDGSAIRIVIRGLERANGVGLSADETRLYVVETEAGRLWGFDVDSPGRVKTDAGTAPGGDLLFEDPELHFDSLALDAEGHICVACPFNGLIARISPAGDIETFITPDDGGPTNICFGGPDLQTAYITQGDRLLCCRWPVPGLAPNYSGL